MFYPVQLKLPVILCMQDLPNMEKWHCTMFQRMRLLPYPPFLGLELETQPSGQDLFLDDLKFSSDVPLWGPEDVEQMVEAFTEVVDSFVIEQVLCKTDLMTSIVTLSPVFRAVVDEDDAMLVFSQLQDVYTDYGWETHGQLVPYADEDEEEEVDELLTSEVDQEDTQPITVIPGE